MNQALSKCGRPQLPGGVTCVPLEKKILVPCVIQPSQGTVTFTKEIPAPEIPCVWGLRAISCDQGSNQQVGVRVQIQLPNGRYLFGGNGVDAGQIAWIGSYRWLQDPEQDFEPLGKIRVTLTDTSQISEDVAINLVFEGVYKYFFEGGDAVPDQVAYASSLPKYRGDVNENILVPAWLQGEYPPLPADQDYREPEFFIYSSPQLTFEMAASFPNPIPPGPQSTIIPIDEGYDFFCRRILIDFRNTAGDGEGIILGQLRTGTGYSFTQDYVDLERYLCGSEFPKDWKIEGRDSVIADLVFVVSALAVSTFVYQIHLEGVRVKK